MSEWKMMTHTDKERDMLAELPGFLASLEYTRAPDTAKRLWQIDSLSIDEDTGDLNQDTGWRLEDYTHWMPLPAPPESQ